MYASDQLSDIGNFWHKYFNYSVDLLVHLNYDINYKHDYILVYLCT